MSRRIRPSARKKALHNVMCSALSETDKKCIKEVFEKFELQKSRIENLEEQRDVYMQEASEYSKEIDILKAEKEALIAGQETLQKALAEKNAEIDDNLINKCIYLSNDETTEYCVDGPCPNFKTKAEIKAEAIKKFAEAFKVKFAKERYRDNYVIDDEMLDNLIKEIVGDAE